jgi:hypothetical protein
MKYIKIIIILSIVSFISCKKVKKLTTFTMEYQSTVVIPSSTVINLPFNLFTPELASNSETTFAINDTRKDLIEQIQLKKLDLKISSPSNGNFDFLKSVEIYLIAEGLPNEKIAWKNNIENNSGNTLSLETTSSDLKEYIKKDKFKLQVNTVTDQLVNSDYHIDIFSLFFVDAKMIGL